MGLVRLWVRACDARAGLDVTVGCHVVVGDQDVDPRVARIVAIDADVSIEFEASPTDDLHLFVLMKDIRRTLS